jgi:DNA-binding IclR family transcriptional regulator
MDNENDLTSELIDLLKYVAFKDGGVDEAEIAEKYSISKPKARYYLDELSDRDYLEMSALVDTAWYVTKAGRKYLFDKNLL